jgi:hypothetical protein
VRSEIADKSLPHSLTRPPWISHHQVAPSRRKDFHWLDNVSAFSDATPDECSRLKEGGGVAFEKRAIRKLSVLKNEKREISACLAKIFRGDVLSF